MSNLQRFIDTLKTALADAVQMDDAQLHEDAAGILARAIASGGDTEGNESEELLLDAASLAQQCGREQARQERRHALLMAYAG